MNITKTPQSKINDVCWKACDTFRGVIDAGQYKDYILVMLFLKYISDTWKEHYENYEKKYKGNKERIERAMQLERFVLPKDADFQSLYNDRNSDEVGNKINIAINSIEMANRPKLDGVFQKINFNSEQLGDTKSRNMILKNLLEDFGGSDDKKNEGKEELNLRPSCLEEDAIGEAYIYLIEKFGSDGGKKAGEFYTPAHVRKLVAKLAKPESGNLICDPACGSGSLLIDAGYEVGRKECRLYGQEKNGSTIALAKMNMFLHDIDDAVLEWGDTLNDPRHLEKSRLMYFDRVVANPPYSLDKWGADKCSTRFAMIVSIVGCHRNLRVIGHLSCTC